MKNDFVKTLGFKLILLLVTIILTFFTTIYMFNTQIDKLKLQIDSIFFANLVPVLKLQKVENSYKDLIICIKENNNCDRSLFIDEIHKNWQYYNKSYKTIEEKMVVVRVDKAMKNALKVNASIKNYKLMLQKINFLIAYEIDGAYKERKNFLNDYLSMKNYLLYSLIVLVFIALAIISFIIVSIIKKDKDLNYLNKKYKNDSITDAMTKLYNRKHFDTLFDHLPKISKENHWKSAFIMCDIDHFKQYNDTYGHDMGDTTLKEVSKVLKEYFNKEYEYVFRLGGEEFGVLLFDTDLSILEQCLDDINKNIVRLQIEHKNSSCLAFVSISMGAVMYTSKNEYSSKQLYKLADQKLYKSKNSGRNKYTL